MNRCFYVHPTMRVPLPGMSVLLVDAGACLIPLARGRWQYCYGIMGYVTYYASWNMPLQQWQAKRVVRITGLQN